MRSRHSWKACVRNILWWLSSSPCRRLTHLGAVRDSGASFDDLMSTCTPHGRYSKLNITVIAIQSHLGKVTTWFPELASPMCHSQQQEQHSMGSLGGLCAASFKEDISLS